MATPPDLNLAFRVARVRARLTQAELADEAGVSLATVSLVERGRTPGLKVQRKLADALGAHADEFWPVLDDREPALSPGGTS